MQYNACLSFTSAVLSQLLLQLTSSISMFVSNYVQGCMRAHRDHGMAVQWVAHSLVAHSPVLGAHAWYRACHRYTDTTFESGCRFREGASNKRQSCCQASAYQYLMRDIVSVNLPHLALAPPLPASICIILSAIFLPVSTPRIAALWALFHDCPSWLQRQKI